MKRCPTHLYRAVFAALLMALMTLSAFGQVQTGSLFGSVVDKDGAPLPGVTVTLTGPGAPQTTVTDAQGRFRFPNLTPGTYSLRSELAGFGQATRAGIGVRLGSTADVTMTLNPSVSQTITVTAEAPLLDVRKTGTGATMSKVELETVPSGRDPWVILQQTPGVLMDRINVGGNESGQQSSYVSKGVTADQTAWNVDGVNITDVGALGSSPTYYDFDSFEEIQITTGGTDVRIQTPGAQINMVTKRGTNDLSGSGRYFMTSGDFQADPEIPSEASTYLASVNEIDNITDMGIEAGGPIIRDRLWLWGAYSSQQIDLFVGQPAGQAVRFADKTELETFNLKLNAQPFAANSLSFAAMLGNKVKLGRNVGPTRPPATAWNQDSNYEGPTMWKIEDTHVFSSNFYLTGLYSKVQGGFQLISDNGKGCQSIECGLSGTPAYLDLTATNPDGTPYAFSGAWQNSFYNYNTERPQDQARLDGSTFFNTGGLSHELKFGFGYRDAEVLSQSGWPGQQYMVFYGDAFGTNYGRPGEIDAFAGAYLLRNANFTYNVNSTDLYVGDTMMFGNLTLQAGLRWDMQEGTVNSGSLGANPVVPSVLPAITFNGDSIGSLEWNSISPRIGLTYAFGADKKTLLRAAANRYHDQLGGFTVYGASPLGYQYLYFYFTDANGNKRVDVGETDTSTVLGYLGLDPNNPGSSVPVRRWDPDMKVPHTDEFMLGFEREVLTDFVVGATGTWRKLNDFIETRAEKTRGGNDFYTPADFQAPQNLTCTPSATVSCGPIGAYTVQYQRLRNDVPPPTYFVFTNAPDYSQTYTGLELSGTKRMSNRWMMRASVTLQDWKQQVGDDYITDPTRQRGGSGCSICDDSPVIEGSGTGSGAKGGVYINSEWAYNLTGAYQIPFIETSLGFNLTGRQGYPIPYIHRSPYLASEQAYKYVLVPEDPTEYRHEDIHNLDLRLAKDFRFGGVGTTFSVDIFNVMNEQPVLQRNTRLGVAAGNRITEIQSPRVFRLGARLTF
jgi:hypothetical protein